MKAPTHAEDHVIDSDREREIPTLGQALKDDYLPVPGQCGRGGESRHPPIGRAGR